MGRLLSSFVCNWRGTCSSEDLLGSNLVFNESFEPFLDQHRNNMVKMH
jgi:hypothetical protein